tara:strand:+ start:346 stop:813 length:468 start_codon:yes stop_codon:yes gene_type:complete
MKWKQVLLLIANLIQKHFGGLEALRKPTSTKEIDIVHLHNILRAQYPKAQVYLSDKTYKLCSPADIKYFLKQDKTNRKQYKTDDFDCDDFAYRLLGQFSIPAWSALAFGMCWTEKHALNCMVGTDGKLYFIEPQSDKIQDKLEAWQGAKVRFFMV